MKIQCPHCRLSGQISDVNVPAEGMNMDCPRCKTSFFVKKEATASWKDTATECPACRFSTFSEERFDICPTCGLVIKDYNEKKGKSGSAPAQPAPGRPPRQQEALDPAEIRQRAEEDLRRLEEKNAGRSYGSPGAMPDLPPEPAAVVPLPVQLVGWTFVLAALAVIVYSGLGISSYYDKLREVAGDQFLAEEFAALHSVWGGVVFPVVQILFGAVTIGVAACFLRLLPWARRGLEICAWWGLAYVAGDQLVSLVNWVRRSSSDATILYYLIGVVSTLVMLALLAAPFLAAIWFLRGDLVSDLFEEIA
ncbi:zinc-ribbon domain-containing protein [Geomobilimonas luticola]|uniref:Zinc-ribbon domain-containing protein n=1 Tax=Geomobilimonas luticola TaxID=1114878 RepID=A0ABS5SE56_9BACT|nr:zinc-ribbon domain-containing protein [Geomobilimonas luticola]MBT0653640.1 zinc-ribbon domain-containing protein [Geomobilimonas luticola]